MVSVKLSERKNQDSSYFTCHTCGSEHILDKLDSQNGFICCFCHSYLNFNSTEISIINSRINQLINHEFSNKMYDYRETYSTLESLYEREKQINSIRANLKIYFSRYAFNPK